MLPDGDSDGSAEHWCLPIPQNQAGLALNVQVFQWSYKQR